MYSIRAEHGKVKYGVYDFVFDTDAEFKNFKHHTNMRPGSTAFILETSETYMLNSKMKWIKISAASAGSGSSGGSSGGSSSSGSTSPDDEEEWTEIEIVYDGGEEVDEEEEEYEVIYDGGEEG